MATLQIPASAAVPPGPQRSLLFNALAAVLGTGAFHLAQLALLALLAKRAGPDAQGVYLLALAVATPVLLLFGLELRGALVADARREFSIRAYLALRRLLVTLAGGVLIAWLLAYAAGGAAPWAVGLAAGACLTRVAWTLTEVPWGLEQRHERLDRVAASTAARGLALLLPPALLLAACPPRQAPAWAALGVGLSAGLSLILLIAWDRPRSARLEPLGVTSAAEIARLARRTLPLGLVALAVNLCDAVPRWLVAAQPDGTTHLAHFGSLAYVTLAGNLVILQAVAAASSRLSATYAYGPDRRAFLRLTARLLLAAALLGGGLLLAVSTCGEWLLRTIFRPEYAVFQREFLLVAGAHALALLTNVLGSATTMMRRFWVQVPVQGLTLLATVVAGWWLIPGEPVRGAALTAVVRALVQFTLYAACFVSGLRADAGAHGRPADAAPPSAPHTTG